jgi:hypothetical protein
MSLRETRNGAFAPKVDAASRRIKAARRRFHFIKAAGRRFHFIKAAGRRVYFIKAAGRRFYFDDFSGADRLV